SPDVGVVRIELQRLLVQVDALAKGGFRATAGDGASLQHHLVSLHVAAGRLVARNNDLAQQLDLERIGHGVADFRLDREHVLELLVVAVRPNTCAIFRTDHADGDADAVTELAYGTHDQVCHAQRRADLRRTVPGIPKL